MTPMLAKIARAIKSADQNPRDWGITEREAGIYARAALLAMREPADGVLWSDPKLLDNAHLFTAVIDAILKEGGE